MKCNSRPKVVLAVLLAFSLFATGCSAQWISVALADLPVLVQMALNIGTVVGTLESGKQISAAEAAAIQNISTQASKDLNLLQTLYNQYKATPNTTTLQAIQSAIADISQNLPALLQAAHISDPTVNARVSAAVNLILTTVASFAALIPQSATAGQKIALPQAAELKKQWNQQVCVPTGKSGIDSALAGCGVK